MTVTTLTDREISAKVLPSKTYSGMATTWTRNSEWYTLPTPTGGGSIIYGLVAIFPDGSNSLAFSISGGSNYTVDWGDGSTAETVTSGVQAQHIYNYSTGTYAVNTTGTLGYKQALVTITSTGGMTTIDLFRRHSSIGASGLIVGWLDISIFGQGTSTLILGSSSTTIRYSYLERVNLVRVGTSALSGANLFTNMRSLKRVEFGSAVIGFNSCNAMFQNCVNLIDIIGTIKIVTTTVTAASMFNNCQELITCPTLEPVSGGKINTTTSMFSGCFSLQNISSSMLTNILNLSGATMTSMFAFCSSLVEAPFFNTSAVTNMTSMFNGCSKLESVPLYNTSSVTLMTTMFNSCYKLKTIPRFNTSSLTNTNQMFSSCYSLESFPQIDLSKVTIATSMFQNCFTIRAIPALNLSLNGSLNATFSGCINLIEIGTLTTGTSLVNMSNTFNGCSSLVYAPTITTTSAVTTTASMFNSCSSLLEAPLFNVSSVTDASQMFANCGALVKVPAYTFSGSLTTAVSMFNSCFGIRNVPAINFVSGTPTLTTIFSNCAGISRVQLPYINSTISFQSCNLGNVELDEIYTNLSSSGAGKTITVTGNWGVANDTPTIATAKGWTVTG